MINQKHYGQLEVDITEKDIVSIWMNEKSGECNVIQIERENIKWLIEILQNQLI